MKRIIAVMAALMFAVVLFNINVSALPDGMTAEEYETYLELKTQYERDYLNLLSQYEHGQISYDEFKQNSDELTQRYNELNTDSDGVINSIAQNASNTINSITNGISNAVGAVGDVTKDYIDDVLNSYSSTTTQNTTDMQGHGAKLVQIYKNGVKREYYCSYIRIGDNNNYWICGTGYRVYYDENGIVTLQDDFSSSLDKGTGTSDVGYNTSISFSGNSYSAYVYGDVRYSDGTQAPTNDEFVDLPIYDFSNATDRELDEVLNELDEKLKREQPDLTSMEGTLKSIYYRLGKVDSDNDNALLSDINNAIMTLMQTNSSENAELVSILLEIRDELKNESNDTSNEDSNGAEEETENGHPNHICGTLYNVKPLDKNWLNKLFTDAAELKVEYQGEKYYLQSCGCLLLDDKYYSVDMNYDSYTQIDYDFSNDDISLTDPISLKDGVSLDTIDWGSAYDMENFVAEQPVSTYSLRNSTTTASIVNDRNFLSDILTGAQEEKIDFVVDLVDNMIALGVPYDSINNSIYMFESIIFDDYTPKDLTFNAFDTDITILSYSWFTSSDGVWEDSNYKTGLDIVRLFTSILIGFAWSLSMRKKIVSML